MLNTVVLVVEAVVLAALKKKVEWKPIPHKAAVK